MTSINPTRNSLAESAAPRNGVSNNVAQIVTMSSREISELLDGIRSGEAPIGVVYEWAFRVIAFASQKVGAADLADLGSMTAAEARTALDDIKSGREYLKLVAPAFDKYPFAAEAIKSHLSALFYAETTLIPFYLLCNKTVAGLKNHSVSTYIVRHPLTGLIKIGRAGDAHSRIKSLQTGAGAILSILAVIHQDIEKELHSRFSDFRRHGEWFEDVDGVISDFALSQERPA